MNEDIITIVTPSYNQGEFIEHTIKSVLTQKGNFYIDYVIMDGGSKDQTIEIVKKYENLMKENCVAKNIKGLDFYVSNNENFEWNKCRGVSYRWVSEEDGGQVNAINGGFKKGIGEIVAWINSDDYYLNEDVFALIFKTYHDDETRQLITGDGSVVDRMGKETWKHEIGRVSLKELIYLDYHVFQPATFWHRDLLKKHELDKNLRSTFDVEFFVSILADKIKYCKLQEIVAAFRMYDDNITDDRKLKMRAFKERAKIMRKYSTNKFYLYLAIIYQFFTYVLKFKCENNLFLKEMHAGFTNFYKKFCYRIILNENYSDRYIIK